MKEKMQPVSEIHLQMDDVIGNLTHGIIDNWLIGIRESNPAILDMLKYPDKKPGRRLLPWSGEFAGKYITCSVLLYRLTKNSKLYTYLQSFIAELISLQRMDIWAVGHLTVSFPAVLPEKRLGTWIHTIPGTDGPTIISCMDCCCGIGKRATGPPGIV